MTGAIPGVVDGVGRLLIVASKKVGGESGDEGIRWVFFFYIFIYLRKLKCENGIKLAFYLNK